MRRENDDLRGFASTSVSAAAEQVGRAHGYLAVASDGLCGAVETPLFPPDGGEPDFLIVRMDEQAGTRRPIVPVSLVERVDPRRELVYLRAARSEIAVLQDNLPLGI